MLHVAIAAACAVLGIAQHLPRKKSLDSSIVMTIGPDSRIHTTSEQLQESAEKGLIRREPRRARQNRTAARLEAAPPVESLAQRRNLGNDVMAPAGNTVGRSAAMITAFITGVSGQQFLVGDNGAIGFGVTTGQAARWNLVDSADGSGGIYMQSASRKSNAYLFDSGHNVNLQFSPESWILSPVGSGLLRFKSASNGNYLVDNSGTLLVSSSLDGAHAANSKFNVTLVGLSWGRSPSDPASPTVAQIFLTGRSGRRLKETSTGDPRMTIAGNSGWGDVATWTVSDAEDGRLRLKSAQGKYLRDTDGTLTIEHVEGNDPTTHWWLAYESSNKMSLQSHSGKFLVEDESGTPALSSGEAAGGDARKFIINLKTVTFH